MATGRTILHVDMDAFFASVEQRDDPGLRGRPVLIGYDGPRGVVAAASYEARPFGCRSAMPMATARRLCPHAVILPVRMTRYVEVSRRVFDVFETVTPIVEPLSIDEAFLDVTGSEKLLGDGVTIARLIRRRIREELHLTASVGVAGCKFLAKLASDLNKPDGLCVIRDQDVPRVLPPLPIRSIWGVGPVTAEKLGQLGIRTIGDLLGVDTAILASRFGEREVEHWHRLARGIDDRSVTPDSAAKSIGQEHTFEVDVGEPDRLRSLLLEQVESVARRLRRHGLVAGGVSLKLRFGEFQTVTRSATLAERTDSTQRLWNGGCELLERWLSERPVALRLLGFTAERLQPADTGQMNLFSDPALQKQRDLDRITDRINERFGAGAIRRSPRKKG